MRALGGDAGHSNGRGGCKAQIAGCVCRNTTARITLVSNLGVVQFATPSLLPVVNNFYNSYTKYVQVLILNTE